MTTPKNESYDIIVIGAGPIGSQVAYKLARLGYQVLVLDKKATPGEDVCCTGILGKECLDTFSINNNLVLRESNSAKFFSPSGKCLRLWRESPVAAIVDRPALNMSLARQAQEVGADYLFGATVTDVRVESDLVKVSVSANLYPSLSGNPYLPLPGNRYLSLPRNRYLSLRAKRSNLLDKVAIDTQSKETVFKAQTAIIATGFGSTLPEKLNLGKIKHFLLGAQVEVDTDIDEVEVYFDQNLAPGGFAWLVPARHGKGLTGLLTTRYLTTRYTNVYLKALLNTLSSQGKITSTEITLQYGTIPLRPLPKTYTDRILVVGGAAGQVKPTTGGGIYYGLICANIAANVLHQAFLTGNFSALSLSTYEKQWRAKLGKELTIGYWARWFYSHLGNRSIDYFFSKIAGNGVAERIVKAEDFSFDWHSRLLSQMMHSLLAFPKLRNTL